MLLPALLVSCSKQMDPQAMSYEGQDTLYCNDPEAINYNHKFPGTADNMVCLYPTDVFVGRYYLEDSVYTADFASYYVIKDTVNIYQLTKTKMAVVGFCGPFDSLKLTAGRYYRATLDSSSANGQPLCSPKDTISGTFSRVAFDSTIVRLDLTMMSDTAGLKYHKGTAKKIQ
ncbi:MAG: hypothetical protein JNL72_01035 [Flavipsychrobacter sp.]|nr:hypothetical protein [Flavipsychrobacter sp.]